MGIDTYRCRIGTFVPSQGACMKSFKENNSILIGAVIIIQILLMRAGVEPNPGPSELNVRCWVLLVVVGTQVIRNVFDGIVGKDVMYYLNLHPSWKKTLQKLNKDQKFKFPPQEKDPKSSKFDISLLVHLLKNVCGLQPFNDPEWNSVSGNSLESRIGMLLKCRNRVLHGEMFSSNADDLRVEITKILHNLNNASGNKIPNLQNEIDDVADMDLDEKLMKQCKEDMNTALVGACKVFQEIESLNKSLEQLNKLFEESVTDQCEHSQKMTTGCDGSSEDSDFCHRLSDTDKILRQYLCVLFDVGREMLRTLVEELTDDFMDYLNEKPGQKIRLTLLDKTNKNSDTQTLYIPLETTNILIEKLNVATLYCLLRNVCGLPEPNDWVWIIPSAIDWSVAANITRLRKCSYKVLSYNQEPLTQQDLDTLFEILRNLNGDGRIADLESQIENAKQRSANEDWKRYLDIAEVWSNRDQLFKFGMEPERHKTGIKGINERIQKMCSAITNHSARKQDTGAFNEHRGTKRRLDKPEDSVQSPQTVKCPRDDMDDMETEIKEIKERLLLRYKKNPQIQLFPEEYEEYDDMLKVFEMPTICHIDRTMTEDKKTYITSYENLLSRDNTLNRNIVLNGEADTGKSCFLQHLTLLWRMAHSGVAHSGVKCNEGMKKDLNFLANFDYIFHVSPPVKVYKIDIPHIIIDRLFYTESFTYFAKLHEALKDIIQTKKCLIIVDENEALSCPKIESENCVYITTRRSDKTDTVQLQSKDAEYVVQFSGLHGDSMEKYVKYLVEKLKLKRKPNPNEFLDYVRNMGLQDKLCIPKLASRLVLLWSKGGFNGKSKEQILNDINHA